MVKDEVCCPYCNSSEYVAHLEDIADFKDGNKDTMFNCPDQYRERFYCEKCEYHFDKLYDIVFREVVKHGKYQC